MPYSDCKQSSGMTKPVMSPLKPFRAELVVSELIKKFEDALFARFTRSSHDTNVLLSPLSSL